MGTRAQFLKATALVAAATIGEGVFALPYIIQTAGWVLTLFYFIALIAAVSVAHVIYLRTLQAVDERERLLGLAEKHFGKIGFWVGFLSIVVGLLLGFVAYLTLGAKFLELLFPYLPSSIAFFIFWLILAFFSWNSEGNIAWLEFIGITLIATAIFFVFFSGNPAAAFSHMPSAISYDFFLPFGAVLFSLAGWTSVEQIYELTRIKASERNGEGVQNERVFWTFVAGAIVAGTLYWLFSLGVIGESAHVAIDTISGVSSWPVWRKDVLAIVGLSSVGVVSLPIAREVRSAMEKDLRWNQHLSRGIIIGVPLAVVLSGFNNFLEIVSLAGGVFLSIQYLLIIAIGRQTLPLARREKLFLDVLSFIFIAAAVYAVWYFIV